MTPSIPPSNSDTIESELVAYLDGELDARQMEAVEQRLSSDVEFRRRLHDLQRTWDLLDSLPRVEATEAFTQSTLEMVAVKAEAELLTAHSNASQRRWLWQSGAGVAVVVALSLGFVFGRSLWSSPDGPLIQDLPVVEHIDEYLLADDIQFLRMLDQEGLFAEETRDAP
ncbi:MAG: hypothetical protein U0939_02260 [Pirellulales bacterium]